MTSAWEASSQPPQSAPTRCAPRCCWPAFRPLSPPTPSTGGLAAGGSRREALPTQLQCRHTSAAPGSRPVSGGCTSRAAFPCVCRQCAAGLQAIANVAADIRAGFYSIGIAGGRGGGSACALHVQTLLAKASQAAMPRADVLWPASKLAVPACCCALPTLPAGGVETLTRDPLDWQGSDNPRVQESQDAQDVKLPLGEPSGGLMHAVPPPGFLPAGGAQGAKALASRPCTQRLFWPL